MLESFYRDLRDALRGLARSPAFALMAVGSLALGMGANGGMLSLVRGLIWQELPVPEPHQMVRILERDPRGTSNMSYANFLDLRDQGKDVFSGVLLHDLRTFGLRRGDRTEVVHGELVSSNYFEVLRLQPELGRLFTGAEANVAGTEPLAVISHHLWTTKFAGDPRIVGRAVELSGHGVRVVGVAPESFAGTKLALGMDVWLTLRPWAALQGWGELEQQRDYRSYHGVARLQPGVGIDSAQAAVDTIGRRLAAQYPDTNRSTGFAVVTETAGNFGGQGERMVATIGGVALFAAGLVLLVACGNVAALLLARGASRQREIAVRRALGASGPRIVRYFLTESLVLATVAAGLGLVLARIASPLLLRALPPLPYRFDLQTTPDGQVLVVMAVGALLTAVLCGIGPAIRANAPDAQQVLRAPVAPSRLRSLAALSGLTLAVCCVTLVLGGLFARSLDAAYSADPGFATAARATASIDVGLAGPDARPRERYFDELIDELGRVPGSRGGALASNLPLTDRQDTADVFDAAQPVAEDDLGLEAWIASVSDGYFDVLEQPLVAGRSFRPADRDGPLVTIVSQELARRLWPDGEALGRRLRLGSSEVAVVGVAADARYRIISEPASPALYMPLSQRPTDRVEVVLHGAVADPALPTRIGVAARTVDARIPVFGEKMLETHVNGSMWMFRMAAGLSGALGLLAGGLALAGVYGVMAYGAQRRRAEIGIRLTLGATRGSVVATLLRSGARLTAVAVVPGLLAAAATAHLARGIVVGVSPYDPVSFVGVGFAVSTLALTACLVPSLVAARIDPARSLRVE